MDLVFDMLFVLLILAVRGMGEERRGEENEIEIEIDTARFFVG